MVFAIGVVLVVLMLVRPVLRFFPIQIRNLAYVVVLSVLGVALQRSIGYTVGDSIGALVVLVIGYCAAGSTSTASQPPAVDRSDVDQRRL